MSSFCRIWSCASGAESTRWRTAGPGDEIPLQSELPMGSQVSGQHLPGAPIGLESP